MQLTRHFTLEQLTCSETAECEQIDNTPGPEAIGNLGRLAKGLEQVQALLGHSLEISSGYRCPALNQRVGGAKTSQHTLGMAADFTCGGFGPPLAIVKVLRESDIDFDQCILEYGRWVHISFSQEPRGKVLTIYDPTEGYLDGLWDTGGKQVT